MIENSKNNYQEIIDNAKQMEQDVLYTEKANFIYAKFWGALNTILTIFIIIFSVLNIALIFIHVEGYSYYGIIFLSVLVTILSILQYTFNPTNKVNFSNRLGRQYNKLRNEIRIFYKIEVNKNSLDENINELKIINEKKHSLDCKLPNIYRFTYYFAKKSIKKGEHQYDI